MATHSNPLVATGVIPANLYNLFIFLEMNQPKQKQPLTKSRLLTSDEHIQMYDEKISKKRQEEEAKQKRKDEHEQRKAEKEQLKKQSSGVKTRGGLRKGGGRIGTCGGKRKWCYITPEESCTEEEAEQEEEEDWECKTCDEDDGLQMTF